MSKKDRLAAKEAARLRLETERYYEELSERESRNPRAELLMFLIGLAMLAAGLFMICQHARVETFGLMLRVFGLGIPTGIVTLPALIGIGMLFFCKKRAPAWIVFGLGMLFILLMIITSVDITFPKTSLFHYIIMFGMSAAGLGLILKSLYGHR